ncbi:uncharacterized protein C8A04DRAFT_32486 [Dichotomopilus funicola]|uniref:Uncharacterized protein n=1 Tax=Dichotomopilus funicola TaxID=1934379 RepID=A0AAN6ZJC4_9PEZI|nr:hypothetical protein C8A04DRAFT_32486 [Dichotomopilus funicola]
MDRPRDLVRRDSDGQTFIIPASQLAGPDDPTPWPRQFTLIARSVMAIMELVTIGYLGYYTHIMRNHGRDARPGLGFVGVILALINDVLVTYVATVQRYTAQRNCYATMIDILSASLACGGAAIVGWVVSVPSDPWFEQHNTAGNLLMGV